MADGVGCVVAIDVRHGGGGRRRHGGWAAHDAPAVPAVIAMQW